MRVTSPGVTFGRLSWQQGPPQRGKTHSKRAVSRFWTTGSDRFGDDIQRPNVPAGRALCDRLRRPRPAWSYDGRVSRPRSLCVLWDGPDLRAELTRLLGALAPEDVLCVSSTPALLLEGAATSVHGGRALGRLLGRAFDAVVLDLREGLDADALGRAEGLVRGGGALVLLVSRLPRVAPALAVHPFAPADVGVRAPLRLLRALASPAAADVVRSSSEPLAPADRILHATPEQAALVVELAEVLAGPLPEMVSILADRGRGKSAALGLAIARALGRGPLRIAVCAADPEGLLEVLRFAPPGGVTVLEPKDVLSAEPGSFDAIVVDEAAQLAVPRLVRIAERHRAARLLFSTTCRGYEGTGRGYVLRFLAWARASGRPLRERTLSAPIRFPEGDPLERFVHGLLLLSAEPAPLAPGPPLALAEVSHERVTQDRLAEDEALLEGAFGLLVHAHYRTSPSDLVRLLDAPNLRLHVLRARGQVVAASLVAREGGLSREHAEALARGEQRIRGHALADTLVTHCQRPDAGALRMLRSVRIATHPELRRVGLARELVSAIHRDEPTIELFGTVFGATAGLVRFRRALGYEIVRVGASRGARSGEPSVVMVHAVSPAAEALVRDLRAELARELPLWRVLLEADGELELERELVAALEQGLPAAVELSPGEIDARVARYLGSAQPSSAAPYALVRFAERHRAALVELAPRERALIEARLLEQRSWMAAAARAGLPSAGAATRALRPAVAALAALTGASSTSAPARPRPGPR